jgi:hypothetical protein
LTRGEIDIAGGTSSNFGASFAGERAILKKFANSFAGERPHSFAR